MPAEVRLSREEIIDLLIERDGFTCQYPGCDREFTEEDIWSGEETPTSATIDHWIPLSLGGTWNIDNLKLMEKKCNAKKGSLMPTEDGALPRRAGSTYRRRADKRSGRPILCNLCDSGRLLHPNDVCPLCGSDAQPKAAPASLQREPKECDHDKFHCWMCYLGFIERKSALQSMIEGARE